MTGKSVKNMGKVREGMTGGTVKNTGEAWKGMTGETLAHKREIWWEYGYLLILALILSYRFLQTTMFPAFLPAKTGLACYILILCYTGAKLLIKRKDYSMQEWLGCILLMGVFFTAALFSRYSFLIELVLLIAGAKDVSYRKIMTLFVCIQSVLLMAAFFASRYAWIVDLVYPSTRGTGLRHSFGILYPTDFAAHVFYLILGLLFLLETGTSPVHRLMGILLPAAGAVLVYTRCYAYTSAICLVLCFLGMLAITWMKQKKKPIPSGMKIFSFLPAVLAAVYFVLTILYRADSPFWDRMNRLLSTRLSVTSEALQKYSVLPFGQFVQENGNGGSLTPKVDYFFLDDSYLRIGLEYGFLVLVLVLVLLIRITRRTVAEQKYVLFLSMILFSVHCFMEHHMLEVSYQVFLLAAFAKLSDGESIPTAFAEQSDRNIVPVVSGDETERKSIRLASGDETKKENIPSASGD